MLKKWMLLKNGKCNKAHTSYKNMTEEKMALVKSWSFPCPNDDVTEANVAYRLPPSVYTTIVHSIEGLDPHRPIFFEDRCYMWKLWSCVGAGPSTEDENEVQFHIKMPDTPNGCGRTQSVLRLLVYYYAGRMAEPVTSSKLPCPCHSGFLYGACCFPVLHSVCERFTGKRSCGLCVNPMHVVAGSIHDHHEVNLTLPRSPAILPVCTPCTTCTWSPYECKITASISGRHQEACQSAFNMSGMSHHAITAQLKTWRNAAIVNHCSTLSPDCHDYHVHQTYMARYCRPHQTL